MENNQDDSVLFTQDNPDQPIAQGILDAEVKGTQDSLINVAKNAGDVGDGGKALLGSIDKNIEKPTGQYIKEVAKGGVKPLIKTVAIGAVAAVTTVLLGPFGLKSD